MATLCACGCGAVVNSTFVRGHHWAVLRRERSGPPQCACGCGAATNVDKLGRMRARYLPGHQPYARMENPTNYNYSTSGVRIHRLRAARALGKPLPPKAVVHHADGSRRQDAPLVICENAAYHRLLHARMRIVAAGGNPNTDRICSTCRAVKRLEDFCRASGDSRGRDTYCRSCKAARKAAA